MSNREIVDSIRRIISGAGAAGGSNATADALAAKGIIVQPYDPRPDQPGARGQGQNPPKSTAGIASPLTEAKDADTGEPARDYYDTQLKTSSDGLFVLPIKPIKTLNFKDALGNSVVIELAEPKQPTPVPTP